MKMRKLIAMVCAFALVASVPAVSVVVNAEETSPVNPTDDFDDSTLDWFTPGETLDGSVAENSSTTEAGTTAAAATTAATTTAATAAAGGSGAGAGTGAGTGAGAGQTAPAGAVKIELDSAFADAYPDGLLIVKAESSKYDADSMSGKFVFAMNEDKEQHTSKEIIDDILGLDGTGAAFQTTALMFLDAKTFALVQPEKLTFTMPGNQLTKDLTSDQMKCFGAGTDEKGFSAPVKANENGTLTISVEKCGAFAVAKVG